MQRTLQTLAAFWCAGALIILIFSTMIEPLRAYIEHFDGVTPYLIRWFVVIAPAPILYYVSERMGPGSTSGH